ncbi:MAG: hypothetical protein JXR10_06855 [Cyclobacteriaceae bacterium]
MKRYLFIYPRIRKFSNELTEFWKDQASFIDDEFEIHFKAFDMDNLQNEAVKLKSEIDRNKIKGHVGVLAHTNQIREFENHLRNSGLNFDFVVRHSTEIGEWMEDWKSDNPVTETTRPLNLLRDALLANNESLILKCFDRVWSKALGKETRSSYDHNQTILGTKLNPDDAKKISKVLVLGRSINETWYKAFIDYQYDKKFNHIQGYTSSSSEGAFYILKGEDFSVDWIIKNFSSKDSQIYIDVDLDWGKTQYHGCLKAKELMDQTPFDALNIVFIANEELQMMLSSTKGFIHYLLRAIPVYNPNSASDLPVLFNSKSKWKAIKLSMDERGIIDNIIHDQRYVASLSDLKKFLLRILSYEEFLGEEIIQDYKDFIELDDLSGLEEFVYRIEKKLKGRYSKYKEGIQIKTNAILVEDDLMVSNELSTSLRKYIDNENEIKIFNRGLEALQFLDNRQELEYPLVFCDLELLENHNEKYTTYQQFWGVDLIEELVKRHEYIVICVLTSKPRSYVEGLLGQINANLVNKVIILFKDRNNHYLPVQYVWEDQLAEIEKQISKNGKAYIESLIGPSGVEWEDLKKFYYHLKRFKLADFNKLWDEIRSNLKNEKHPESYLKWKRPKSKRDKQKENRDLLVKGITIRLLIFQKYCLIEGKRGFKFKSFVQEHFNLNYDIGRESEEVYLSNTFDLELKSITGRLSKYSIKIKKAGSPFVLKSIEEQELFPEERDFLVI